MKQKILYAITTAVIATTAFFVGKNFTEQPTQPETKAPENIKDIFQERADDYHKEAQEAEKRLLFIRREIKEYFEYIGKL